MHRGEPVLPACLEGALPATTMIRASTSAHVNKQYETRRVLANAMVSDLQAHAESWQKPWSRTYMQTQAESWQMPRSRTYRHKPSPGKGHGLGPTDTSRVLAKATVSVLQTQAESWQRPRPRTCTHMPRPGKHCLAIAMVSDLRTQAESWQTPCLGPTNTSREPPQPPWSSLPTPWTCTSRAPPFWCTN